MAAAESNEQHFWPGYVDTLVNMVMFLILLIVILSMAVMYFSIKARNEGLRSVPQAISDNKPKQPSYEEIVAQLDAVKQKLYLSEQKYEKVVNDAQAKLKTPGKTQAAEKTVDATKILTASTGIQEFSLRPASIIVRFKPGAIELGNEEAGKLAEIFAGKFGANAGQTQTFELTVTAVEGLSESSRMAFYRIAAVRNRLMTKAGVARVHLTQRIVQVPLNQMNGTEGLEVVITPIAK